MTQKLNATSATAAPRPLRKASAARATTPEAAPQETPVSTQTAIPAQANTLGVMSVPLSQLIASNCNVRETRTEHAVDTLADSLARSGQLQNLSARWSGAHLEVVAGETRRQAFVKLADRGVITRDHPVAVRVVEADDVQARSLSAAENLARTAMGDLETCDTLAKLHQDGLDFKTLAETFGLGSARAAEARVRVATDLSAEGRQAMLDGTLNIAKAAVVARAPGEALQRSLLAQARYRTTEQLLADLTNGQFLISHATFDVQASGLDIIQDLFQSFPAYFKDKAAALNAQLAHAETIAAGERQTGDWTFVDVVQHTHYFSVYSGPYHGAAQESGGLALSVSSSTGELTRHPHLLKRAVSTAPAAEGAPVRPPRGVGKAGHILAHALKAAAVQDSLLGQTTKTLAIAVHGLILGTAGEQGSAGLMPSRPNVPLSTAMQAAVKALQTQLADSAGRLPDIHNLADGTRLNSEALYRTLNALDDAALLGMLNTLIAARSYATGMDITARENGVFRAIGQDAGAQTKLAEEFELTQEYLAAYPQGELVKLAEEAGLDSGPIRAAKTGKEARARVLEQAKALHRQGFLPALLRFTQNADKQAAQDEKPSN